MKPETVAPPPEPSRDGSPLVSIQDLKTYYSIRGSFLDRLAGREAGIVRAVDGVSIDIRRGEVLGLVGESGSGKTTLGRTLLGLVKSTGGSMQFEGQELSGRSEREWRDLRRQIQVVFQDPHASLNPAMTIEQAVGHPLQIHGLVRNRTELQARVIEVLEHCRPGPGCRLPRQVPVRSLGRPEAARRDRAGDHPQPRAARRGRARLDAGHECPREDPRADDRAQARPRAHVPLHHARPRDRALLLRPDRDHVPREDRRDRPGGSDLRRSEAPVHPGVAPRDTGARP